MNLPYFEPLDIEDCNKFFNKLNLSKFWSNQRVNEARNRMINKIGTKQNELSDSIKKLLLEHNVITDESLFWDEFPIPIITSINSTGMAFVDIAIMYKKDNDSYLHTIIEINGSQHYTPKFGIKKFNIQKKRDAYINLFCKYYDINLIIINVKDLIHNPNYILKVLKENGLITS